MAKKSRRASFSPPARSNPERCGAAETKKPRKYLTRLMFDCNNAPQPAVLRGDCPALSFTRYGTRGYTRRMKSGFWKTDWFLGLAVVVAFVFFNRATDLVAGLERKAYDLGVQASNRVPDADIVVIAIDDASIANIGRWPWQREVLANCLL